MTPQNEQILIQELERDEGVELRPYKDTRGILTVGVGHNLEANPLPKGTVYPLTLQQVGTILAKDLVEIVYQPLNANLAWWSFLDDVRERVLANMCFNMGWKTLSEFKNTLGLIHDGKYSLAASEMLDSTWAHQVGIGMPDRPGRALRLSNMMRNGVA